MADRETISERQALAGDAPQDEVARRLAELTTRKRGRVRWRMSKHTAEMAIRALHEAAPARRGGHGKQRRRKRRKRLL